MHTIRVGVSLLLPLVMVAPLAGATQAAGAVPASGTPPRTPLFASNEPLQLTLEADFTTILKDRSQDSEYGPATLT